MMVQWHFRLNAGAMCLEYSVFWPLPGQPHLKDQIWKIDSLIYSLPLHEGRSRMVVKGLHGCGHCPCHHSPSGYWPSDAAWNQCLLKNLSKSLQLIFPPPSPRIPIWMHQTVCVISHRGPKEGPSRSHNIPRPLGGCWHHAARLTSDSLIGANQSLTHRS